jgi:hypothetical protein
MAAPLGFKTFTTGEVLTAADTNGYLMQGVLVFASAAARTAAVTSPQEGQTSYLKDTDEIQVYSGSAWVTKSGGSSSSLAQIATGTLSGASVTISSLSTYDQLFIQLTNVYMSTDTGISVLINNNTGASNYSWNGFSINANVPSAAKQTVTRAGWMPFYQNNMPSSSPDNTTGFTINNCKAAGFTNAYWSSYYYANTGQSVSESAQGRYLVAEAVSSLVLKANAGTFSGGTYTIWGA